VFTQCNSQTTIFLTIYQHACRNASLPYLTVPSPTLYDVVPFDHNTCVTARRRDDRQQTDRKTTYCIQGST